MKKAVDHTDTIVRVTARVLGWSEARVRADRGRYAAFQRDDAFAHDHIDWSKLSFTKAGRAAAEQGPYGRRDVDVERSLFGSRAFGSDAPDLALRPLFEKMPALYGSQIQELIGAGRIDKYSITSMTGRIRGGETLVEAMRALLGLGSTPLAAPRRSDLHVRWRSLIEGLAARDRRSVGMFFQSEEAARTVGACFDGRGETPEALANRFDVIAAWDIGEAQGEVYLTRIVDDRIPAVPAFKGRAAPTLAPVPRPGSLKAFMKQPLKQHLRESYSYSNICGLLGSSPDKELATLLGDENGILQLANALGISLQERHYRVVLGVATRALAKVPAPWQLYFENLRANALAGLGWTDEAYESAVRCLALAKQPQTPHARFGPSIVHNVVAWTAYLSGKTADGVRHARKAVAADRKNLPAQSTLAVLLYDAGEEDEAFTLLAKTMAKKLDPEPKPTLRADPRYQALCARYGIRATPLPPMPAQHRSYTR